MKLKLLILIIFLFIHSITWAETSETENTVLTEKAYWSHLQQSKYPEDWEKFLELYPESDKTRQVHQKLAELQLNIIEQRAWDKAVYSSDASLLQGFIVRFPDSPRTKIAHLLIKQRRHSSSSANVGNAIWKQISNSNDPKLYKAFIRTFPGSSEAEMAAYKLGIREPDYLKTDQKNNQSIPLTSQPYWRSNEGRFYFGLGRGIHYFAVNDDVRTGSRVGNENVTSLKTTNLYFDYYWSGSWGIGFDFTEGSYSAQYGTGASSGSIDVSINSFLLSLSRISPMDTLQYFHWGMKYGIGITDYNIRYENIESEEYSSDGVTLKADFFIDWGGDVLGARFGSYLLIVEGNREHPDEDNSIPGYEGDINMDPSGMGWYLSLRWAF